jgi:hypothetical protein
LVEEIGFGVRKGIETHDSAEYRYAAGQLQRSRKPQQLRGLNRNYNHDLKNLF